MLEGVDNNNALVTKLRKLSNTLPVPKDQPGALVLFPGVPGLGKSRPSNRLLEVAAMAKDNKYFPGANQQLFAWQGI